MLSRGLGAGALALTPSSMLELSKEQLRLQIPDPATVHIHGLLSKVPACLRERAREMAPSPWGGFGVLSSSGWGTC